MMLRVIVGLVAGVQAIACSSSPGTPAGSGPPPGGPPLPPSVPPAGAPVVAPVASGIPEPIYVSFMVLDALKTRDAGRLSAVAHSSVRAAVAARRLDDTDFWVQAAARDRGSKARSDGTRWLVSFADLGSGELAVLVLMRDGGPLKLVDVQRMPTAGFEAFGAPAS